MKKLIFAVLILVMTSAAAVAGDVKPKETTSMESSFRPPNISSLADIDTANVPYESECVVIDGVVSPDSQSGHPRPKDGHTVHFFRFAAWRPLGEPILRRELLILRPVRPDADYFGDFPSYSVHRISVLLSKNRTRAVFDKSLPMKGSDRELQKISAELRKPVVISTKLFGDLVLDRKHDWFEGEVEWNGQKIQVTFPVDENGSITNALKIAELMWSQQKEWKRRIDEFAVGELLELKNGSWLGDDEKELTPDQFKNAMKLESITFHADGGFEFWHNDGDLFWGHSIQISGNVKDGPTNADIPG